MKVSAFFKHPFFLAIILATFLAANHAWAQKAPPPSKAELEAITTRGRLLAEYDLAVSRASDAVKAIKPAADDLPRAIARKNDPVWTVVFGRINDQGDKFLIAYQATQAKAGGKFAATKLDPPKEDAEYFLAAAKAIDISLRDFAPVGRPYRALVLPAESSQLYVYVLPAQTQSGVYLLGNDARYLVSSDGSKLVIKHRMHLSIVEFKSSNNVIFQMHEHIMSDLPEDSDVLHVLTRQPAIQEIVVTENHRYVVEVGGKIRLEK